MTPNIGENSPAPEAQLRLGGFYGRVSGPDDVSIDVQLAIAREHAARLGYRIPSGSDFVYKDVHTSGATLSRNGFDRLKRLVTSDQAPFDVLFIRESARFGRWDDPRQYDFHSILFENHGVKLYFCDAERQLDFSETVDVGLYISHTVNNVQNARERKELKRKMRRARRHHAKDGFYPGGATPYGFERVLIDKRTREVVRVVPEGERIRIDGCLFSLRPLQGRERQAIRFIFDKVEEGLTLRGTAAELNRLGYPAPNGWRWHGSKVGNIVRNPIYMGTLTWGRRGRRVDLNAPPKAEIEGDEVLVIPDFIKDPPISKEQFSRVQAALSAHRTLWERRRASAPKYLFTGLIVCPICGKLYSGLRQSRTDRRVYRHNSSEAASEEVRSCPEYRKYIRSEDLEAFILEHIRQVLVDPDLEKRVREEIRRSLEGTQHEVVAEQIAEKNKRLASRRAAIKRLEDSLEKVESDSAHASLIERINTVGREIDGLRTEIDELEAEEQQLAANLNYQAALLAERASLVEQLDSGSFELQRAVIEHVVEYIHARATKKELTIALRYV